MGDSCREIDTSAIGVDTKTEPLTLGQKKAGQPSGTAKLCKSLCRFCMCSNSIYAFNQFKHTPTTHVIGIIYVLFMSGDKATCCAAIGTCGDEMPCYMSCGHAMAASFQDYCTSSYITGTT